jgi:hypothetical protein
MNDEEQFATAVLTLIQSFFKDPPRPPEQAGKMSAPDINLKPLYR